MKIRSLIRKIGRALFLLSWCIMAFFFFSSRRVISAPFFLKSFILSLILAGGGALAILVAEKMEIRTRSL